MKLTTMKTTVYESKSVVAETCFFLITKSNSVFPLRLRISAVSITTRLPNITTVNVLLSRHLICSCSFSLYISLFPYHELMKAVHFELAQVCNRI